MAVNSSQTQLIRVYTKARVSNRVRIKARVRVRGNGLE